jgi:hypothetical protein
LYKICKLYLTACCEEVYPGLVSVGVVKAQIGQAGC